MGLKGGAVEATRFIASEWLNEFPNAEERLQALVDMHESDAHEWRDLSKYFKEIPMGRPIVSPNIRDHKITTEVDRLLDTEYKEFAVAPEEAVELHFSFRDEKEDRDTETPIAGFFTVKKLVRPLRHSKEGSLQLAVYQQMRFMIDAELMAELHPALRNAIHPLALDEKRNLSPLLRPGLAALLMETSPDRLSPIQSHEFAVLEKIKEDEPRTVAEDPFDDTALDKSRQTWPHDSAERELPPSFAA